jgi:hypothetical protein
MLLVHIVNCEEFGEREGRRVVELVVWKSVKRKRKG